MRIRSNYTLVFASIGTAFALCGGLVFGLQTAQAMSFKQSAIGYHPQGPKVAILEDVPEDQKIEVVLFDPTKRNPKLPVFLGASVFKVENIQAFQDVKQQGPANRTLLIDFSAFQTPGSYELRVEGTDIKSQPIKINEFLYWDLLKPVVRTFYFQRCGNEIEDRSLKLFRSACHLHDAQRLNPTTNPLLEDEPDVIGGWHNGSDYAKYVTSTALSAARLMAMHEWEPKPFKYLRLDYPLFEPGYGTTDDLHHEIQAGLDWLLTMQRKDGALFRKVAGKTWPGKISPVEDEQTRYIYGISTQDTAAAAAAWAMATRDFKKADLGYSVKTLLAAEKAWDFLETHPQPIYQRSPQDFSGSGEFLTDAKGDLAYRVWAAAELYTTTGKPKYHQYLLNHLQQVPMQRFTWMNPAFQGYTDYLLKSTATDSNAAAYLKQSLVRLADGISQEIEADVNLTGLSRYGDNSNAEIAERAALLLVADKVTGNHRYREAASRSIYYLFGLNPLGQIYITGLAGQSVQHPAHRWMQVSQQVIPGYLVDGPNQGATDGATPKALGPLSYADDPKATGSNEVRLLNNASLAYVLALLNDAYNAATATEETDSQNPLNFKLAPERAKPKGKTSTK